MASELIKAVLDTNVVVSASLQPLGIPASIVAAGISRKFIPCLSADILAEYREVLSRGKFSFPSKRINAVVADIESAGELSKPSKRLSVCADDDDNFTLQSPETRRFLTLA